MIPPFLVARFGPLLAKVIFWCAVAALVIAVLMVGKCSYDRRARTEVNLAKGQAGAAVASGTDAVGTVGNRMAADAAGDTTVMETKDAIDNATDAGGVTAAGRSGLCGLAGNRGKPECMR
jgi:hypothetical protein